MGRFPRSVEMITHRFVIGSFLSSGNAHPPPTKQLSTLNSPFLVLYAYGC
jgi:hypothetical protein